MTNFEHREPDVISAGALTQLTRGEVDMQVTTAKQFPRSIKRFEEETLSMATLDQETATECTYTLPRAGKFIVGPSIRFAEILGSAWGNLREEKRTLEPEENLIRGQATVWDLERNRLVRAEVTRRITDKKGRRFNEDMIVVTGNAAASIAHRNALLSCIPKAFWKKIHDQVMHVAAGDAKTLDENRTHWLAWWEKHGVSTARVLSALCKPSIEDIGLTDLGVLQGLCTAYREGTLDLDTAFPPPGSPGPHIDASGAPQPGVYSFRGDNGKTQPDPGPAPAVETAHEAPAPEPVKAEAPRPAAAPREIRKVPTPEKPPEAQQRLDW